MNALILWAVFLFSLQCIAWMKFGLWQPVPFGAMLMSPDAQRSEIDVLTSIAERTKLHPLDLVPSFGTFSSLDNAALAISNNMIGVARIAAWFLDVGLVVWLIVQSLLFGFLYLALED